MSARKLAVLLVALSLLLFGVWSGPRASMGTLEGMPDVGRDVDAYLAASERGIPDLRPGAAKRVVWRDSTERRRTGLALVYLHGFSADPHEVEPLMTDLGRTLGANVYFARLAGHGRSASAMGEVTVDDWLEDTAEAVAVGRRLGTHVILVGTSTGGTLATWAAMEPRLREHVSALVLLSPNFHPADPTSRVLLWPWGGWIARLVEGPERCSETHGVLHERYWTTCYPTRALLPMMALVEHVRTSELERVTAPALVAYVPGDRVVDARETQRAFGRLGSARKEIVPVEEPGDPDRHVPAGAALSPQSTDLVQTRIEAFIASLELSAEGGEGEDGK
ncbi:MAG: alpha/beta fold hydrolase [Gemmatimonadota bacterium]|nr:alpha/beta fold hydrolase [Gemmatimonadota bacterium]